MPYSGSIGAGEKTPHTLTKRGSDFTGVDGAANRTYDAGSDALADGLIVVIDNNHLHKTSQFTFVAGVITILDPLDDVSYVEIIYFTTGA